jgi:hypothetical protein
MDFNSIISWCTAFHILTPVPATERFAQTLMNAMANGGAQIDYEKFDQHGLMTCSCNTYMHYCNCSHACAWLVIQGIFTDYPETLHPATIGGEDDDRVPVDVRPHRIQHAKRGGALGRV